MESKHKSVYKTLIILVSIGLLSCSRWVPFQPSEPEKVSEELASIYGQSSLSSYIPDNSTFSGYIPPASKQGIGEARVHLTGKTLHDRYWALRHIGFTYRSYNFFWSDFEGDQVASSAQPINCPEGTVMIPRSPEEKRLHGFHRYRCLSRHKIEWADRILSHDQSFGMQSAAVVFSAPRQYQYKDCNGFEFGDGEARQRLYIGCVPRDDAMNDYEDYVNFLARRYNGGTNGKISYFIVWNENASYDWMDYSPITAKNDLSPAAVDRQINKYVSLLQRTHRAVQRHIRGALLLVSIDHLWESEGPKHIGSRRLLDGIWEKVNTKIDWSLAVHPYGDPIQNTTPHIYTFADLQRVVDYQKQKLEPYKQPQRLYPQILLAATEQGWPVALGRDKQAESVCYAHDRAVKIPELVAVSHNYFHSIEPAEETGRGSGQGAYFGLIPYGVKDDFSNINEYLHVPTVQAYLATANTDYWGRRNDHYCCQAHQLGCFDGDYRFHPDVFNPDFYRQQPSLEHMTDQQLQDHWITYGIRQGWQASPVFDVNSYRERYADLRSAFGDDRHAYLKHYVDFGLKEGRVGTKILAPVVFDVAAYRGLNGDLHRMSFPRARLHWAQRGIHEGRRSGYNFDVREYIHSDERLREAFAPDRFLEAIRYAVDRGGQSSGQ